jgi:NDP-sugar pyrophosphorylase family protein
MILAAGLGTRLRPLTDHLPKALAPLAGRTLLEITLTRLRSFGVGEVIVNVHHMAGMVEEYLRVHDDFGMKVEISREEALLDTGGGLKKAAHFFLRDGRDEPFFVHNVDVLSDIDLAAMLRSHRERDALATLAVRRRVGSRRLLFDAQHQLCGRRTGDAEAEMARPAEHFPPQQTPEFEELTFAGIHVLSPRIFPLMHEEGCFPIVPVYLRLAAAGENIVGFRTDQSYWRDLGTAASLQAAADDLAQAVVSV